jgi:hypothetical protein
MTDKSVKFQEIESGGGDVGGRYRLCKEIKKNGE